MQRLSVLLLIVSTYGAYSQVGLIKGVVTKTDGTPLEFVTVSIKGIQLGSITDRNGEFAINAPSGGVYTVVASIIGFASRQIKVSVTSGKEVHVDIELSETPQQLDEIEVSGVRAITGLGYLTETSSNVIYSGKKTEVILLDSLDANTAQNNPRQVLGRVPGANYSETQGSGFPSNGIGFRGLNPSQSIETNTRQNGYNVAADLYGYPESYYLPPLEAVERIEITRGASSLQFGPQFGGVINYVLQSGSKSKPLEFAIQQTGGSFGLYNSFNSIGGQVGKINYYSFVQLQTIKGWRPNSTTQSASAYARVEYQHNSNIKFGIECTFLRNRIQMPGGLTDSMFYVNSRKSFRARNWLRSPWNIMTATVDWKVSTNTTLSIKSSTNVSARELVWRNEDGGPGAIDEINPLTNDYVNREVEHEDFKNNTTELRLLRRYSLGAVESSLATGARFFYGRMKRQGGGIGTTGSDFDLTLLDPYYEYDLKFTTTNFAVFAENIFRFGEKLSVIPGLRYEFLNSKLNGYNPSEDETGVLYSSLSRNRNIFLAGVGLQYKATRSTNIYANMSQAYRPIDYSNLTPFGSIITVDKNLKDASGYNADFGFRGTIKEFLNFDVGAFYLKYNNRIGIIEINDPQGNQSPYRTNVARSVHQGIESYIEFSPVKALSSDATWNFSFFNSLAIINAKYVTGEFKGKYVEYAPTSINRLGVTLGIKKFSTTLLFSRTAKSYGDANNSDVPSADAIAGTIPAYSVVDWSTTMKIKNFNVKAGINNLSDSRYFTKRTDEYPGPGIIPSIGRSFYIGFGAKF